MGLRTPYRRMAFPDNGPVDLAYLNMQGLSAEELAAWQKGLMWFVKLMTYHMGKQVLLKSPPHTGRSRSAVANVSRQFIHITRIPYSLYPSTIKLWRTLHFAQGFQMSGERSRKVCLQCFDRMYAGFTSNERLGDDAIVDMRYEDLVADPVGELHLRAAQSRRFCSGRTAARRLRQQQARLQNQSPPHGRNDARPKSPSSRAIILSAYGYEK